MGEARRRRLAAQAEPEAPYRSPSAEAAAAAPPKEFTPMDEAAKRLFVLEIERARRPRGGAGTAAARADGYEQPEAFSLMEYACAAGHREIIWNARPHVTPFVIRCRVCGEEAPHARWGADAYAPTHHPQPGDRVFLDITPERARQFAERRVDAYWNDVSYPLREREDLHGGSWDAAVAFFVNDFLSDFGGHAPDLVEVDEQLAARLRAESEARRATHGAIVAQLGGAADAVDKARILEEIEALRPQGGGRFA